jgi:ribosomal protein S12 methylthiotransferase
VEDLVREAKNLAKLGVKELILIAQDTTYYGQERGSSASLLFLLEKLEKIEALEWMRVLYLHPLHFDFRLIEFMQRSSKICRYLDIPLQHTHNEILKWMGRPSFEIAEKIIERVRESIPEVSLRTTLMVGFPGEESHHFKKLLRDVERLQFDWLGVFTYSREKNTPAYSLSHQVCAEVKKKRKEELLLLQRSITLKKNQERVGKIYPVLVDFNPKSGEGEGHTPFQTPEIDGKVFFSRKKHSPGEIFQGRVLSVKDSFDLYVN